MWISTLCFVVAGSGAHRDCRVYYFILRGKFIHGTKDYSSSVSHNEEIMTECWKSPAAFFSNFF